MSSRTRSRGPRSIRRPRSRSCSSRSALPARCSSPSPPATPLVPLAVGIAGALFVAIAAGEPDDDDFEWWSGAGAWLLIVSGVWLAAGSLVFLGPPLMHALAVQLTRINLTLAEAKLLLG